MSGVGDDLGNAVGRAYALRLLADRMAADNHWNAVLQGLLAQGMPYESAMLHIQRLQEQQAAQQAAARHASTAPWRALGVLILALFAMWMLSSVLWAVIPAFCLLWVGSLLWNRRKGR